jgi:hypothetical protein
LVFFRRLAPSIVLEGTSVMDVACSSECSVMDLMNTSEHPDAGALGDAATDIAAIPVAS